MPDSTTVKKASQGVRQLLILTDKTKKILMPGDTFLDIDGGRKCIDAEVLFLHEIQSGTIGIVHETNDKGISEVSIIRDDCKAARKALRNAQPTLEERLEVIKEISADNIVKGYIETVQVYSQKEMTEKKYTVAFAVEQARSVLKNKHNTNTCCVTAVQRRSINEMLTIVEVNEIVDSIVFDTIY